MKLLRAAVAGAVVGGAAIQPVGVDPAASYVLYAGNYCHWSAADRANGIGVGVDTGSAYYRAGMYDATTAGMARWNVIAAGDPTTFGVVNWGSAHKDLSIGFVNEGAHVGPALWGAQCGTYANPGWVGSPEIAWNVSFAYPSSTSGFSSYDLQSATAVHELGHTLGMEHNNTSGCNPNTAGMMYGGTWNKVVECTPKGGPVWNNPTIDDVDGARAAHP